MLQLISDHAQTLKDPAEATAFLSATALLRDAAAPYVKSHAVGVPGSERVMTKFLDILRKWVSVERWFYDGKSYADAVDNLRKAYKNEAESVLNACRAHARLSATSDIIDRMITLIGDGSRVDSQTSTATPIGKRVSILTGAESLSEASACLSDIAAIGADDAYAQVASRARKLLLQESMPSLEQRKNKVRDAASKLSTQSEPTPPKEVSEFISEQIPIGDVFFPVIKDDTAREDEVGVMELYMRHLYRTYSLKDVRRVKDERLLKFSFVNKPSESAVNTATSVTSMTDLTRLVRSSSSLSKLGETSDNDSDSNLVPMENIEKISPQTVRTGVFILVDQVDDLKDAAKFESILGNFPQFSNPSSKSSSKPCNVLYIVVAETSVGFDSAEATMVAEQCESLLSAYVPLLEQAELRRVSFVFNHGKDEYAEEYSPPAMFTYRYPDFDEDSLYRDIEPSHAYHLQLTRVAANYRIHSLGSRHTTTCHVHLYEATPKVTSLAKDKIASKHPRIFVRALSSVIDFSSAGFERILVDALNSLDLVALRSKTDNHLFINLVSDFEKAILDPVVVEEVVVSILKRHGARMTKLGLVEVETRVVCCLSKDSPPIALRLVASNPTGYVHVMSTYVEAFDEAKSERVFKLIGGTKASLAGSGDSSWEGLNVNKPYPLTRPFDAQRKSAMKASDTLYCYDLPALFEAAVEQQWLDAAEKGGIEGGIRAAARPLMVMYTSELVVHRKNRDTESGDWTMKDYLAGDLELVQMNRGAGANDVGMVAWLMVLKTVEYPEVRLPSNCRCYLCRNQFPYARCSHYYLSQGRQVVLIANDITHKAGSFGTREDVVFKLASEFARKNRIPRLFIAANSGARIGLAEGVKKSFKVAFKDPSKPENGFDFIYMSKDDYKRLGEERQELIAEKTTLNGEEVYKVTDIIGSEPDLGVENLKGSGLIAGETSAAYEDIFTMTIVLGRYVRRKAASKFDI